MRPMEIDYYHNPLYAQDEWTNIIAGLPSNSKNDIRSICKTFCKISSINNLKLYASPQLCLTSNELLYAKLLCTYKNAPRILEKLHILDPYYNNFISTPFIACPLKAPEGSSLPCLQAAYFGNTKLIKKKNKKNRRHLLCSTTVNNDTLFHLAVYNGHGSTIRYLLNQPLISTLHNKEGFSPLYIATIRQHTYIVEMLLGKTPYIEDINIYNNLSSCFYQAMKIAINTKNLHILECFLRTTYSHLLVNTHYEREEIPLLMAVRSGNPDLVQQIISHPACIRNIKYKKMNALLLAAQLNLPYIITIILQYAPELINTCNKEKNTALHIGAYKKNYFTIKTLLRSPNIHINQQNARHKTPLDIAYQKQAHQRIIRLLKNKGGLTGYQMKCIFT